MSSCGYRLDRSLMAVQYSAGGRSALRVLEPGAVLLVCAGEQSSGLTRVLHNNTEYYVFLEDLEERATRVAVDLRKPAGLYHTAAAMAQSWVS